MKYTGQFRTIDNELLTVYIITDRSEAITRDITLSGNPFSTEMDTSDDNIYKPVKYQSATVGVVTENESDYMFNVYSGDAKSTSIRLYNSNNVLLWGGFATPVVYNNGYTSVHEELEIEAIDGLSILQYYKYHTSNKSIKTFAEILKDILSICEVYTYFYVSDSQKITSSSAVPLLNELYISEQNFFDEKEDDETDDDVAWTCKEVLEEICQYLGLVCIAEGNSVYFLDLDAIRNGNKNYWRYTISTGGYTRTTLENAVAINGDLFRGSSSNISLDNVYNKVSVKDDFYEFEDIIPDIYDTAQNITKSTDPTLTSSTDVRNGAYGEVVQGVQGNRLNETNNNMICMIDRIYDPEEEEYTHYNAVFAKYFNHPSYVFYNYFNTLSNQINYTDTKTMHGACIAKFFVKKLEHTPSFWEMFVRMINGNEMTLDEFLARDQISNITFTNYIMMVNPESNHISNDDITSYPYFQTISQDTTALFGGDNAYLVIKGSYMYHYFSEDPYPIPEDEPDISEGRYAMHSGQTYLLAKLQWGSQYWNGSSWVTSSTTFKIPYMRDDSGDDERRADATMFKKIDFVNTVTWRIGISDKGYMIPMPSGKVMSGMPVFTMYKPFDPDYFSTSSGDEEGQWYKHTVVFLKDFSIKAVIGDPTYSDVNESDTVYTNIIDDHHVQDLDEIKFKICTNDNKNPNYSSVAYKTNGNYQFLDTIYNSSLTNNGVVNHEGSLSTGLLRPEEWLIYRLTNQYQEPRVRLELELNQRFTPYTVMTDKWLVGKKFIIDSQSTDWRTGVNTVTLVEKG